MIRLLGHQKILSKRIKELVSEDTIQKQLASIKKYSNKNKLSFAAEVVNSLDDVPSNYIPSNRLEIDNYNRDFINYQG